MPLPLLLLPLELRFRSLELELPIPRSLELELPELRSLELLRLLLDSSLNIARSLLVPRSSPLPRIRSVSRRRSPILEPLLLELDELLPLPRTLSREPSAFSIRDLRFWSMRENPPDPYGRKGDAHQWRGLYDR